MEFHDFRTLWDGVRKILRRDNPDALTLALKDAFHDISKLTHDGFYRRMTQIMMQIAVQRGRLDNMQEGYERRWYKTGQPYYKVWPGVVRHLIRLDLDKIDAGTVEIPKTAADGMLPRTLMFRFVKGAKSIAFEDDAGKTHELRAMLGSWIRTKGPEPVDRSIIECLDKDDVRGLAVYMDWGEEDETNFPVHSYAKMPVQPGETLQHSFDGIPISDDDNIGLLVPKEKKLDALRVVAMCCLMQQSEDGLVSPDVLMKDQRRWDDTKDIKFVEKARRRGKYGWHIGRALSVDVTPYFRSAHPCLVWYGPGKKLAKVIIRKEHFVKREKVVQVPTGRGDDDDT